MTLKRITAYLMIVVMLMGVWPNTYYAASFNHVNKVLTVMNGETLSADEAPILSMTLINTLEENAIFYIELAGGKWLDTPYEGRLKGHQGSGTLEIKKVNAQKLQVKVKGEDLISGTTLQIPLALQMTGETAIATVKSNNTVVSSGSYVIAEATSYKGQVTAADEVPTTTDSGVMVDLVIQEAFSKAFSKAVASGKNNIIELRLNHNAFAFSLVDSEVRLIPGEGFEDLVKEDFKIKQIDAQTLALTLPDTSAAQYTGMFTLSGIYIQRTDKNQITDRLTVTATGDLIETTTLEVLEVMDYAIALKGNSQTVRAGSTQTVQWTLEEQVAESLVRNRPTYFTFTEGITLKTVNGKVPVYINGQLDYWPTVIENGKIVGFEITRLPENLKQYEMKVEVVVMPTASGNIKVIAEGRSLVENLSLSVLEVYRPFKVTIQAFDTLVGIKDQVGGQVILQETAAREWIQGEKIILELEASNIQYSGLPKVLVTAGDLRLGEAVIVGNRIEIPVIRSSHSASTVVIRDFRVTIDQTIANGEYTLQIGGGAFSTLATDEALMPVAQGTFIRVTQVPIQIPNTPNDEIPEMIEPTTKVIFTLGQSTYQIGEQIKVMDAAPYASNGRTMLPIKYVSEALGIPASHIQWHALTKTVTIYAKETVILQLGSNIMTINGQQIIMSAEPEVVNGRTFVPVAEITRALGVTTNWDHMNKQVTFMV